MATGRSTAEPPSRARVTAPWRASYDPALAVARGEALTPGGTDPDNSGWRWPGWRWPAWRCHVNAAGRGGWLPEGPVVAGRATAAFDSAELTVAAGEVVLRGETVAGRAHCRTADGRRGWLPCTCLAPP